MLYIQLLGPPQITLDQRPVRIERRKSRALLYYLAAQSSPLTRERLMAVFWPDHPRPAAQQTLRTTLYGLRKALGPALVIEDETVALSPEVDVDVRKFERFFAAPSLEISTLSAILDLYRGDFLADFNLPDPPAFEDWLVFERERLRRLAVRGLTMLSAAYEAGQDYAGALASLDRALAFNPLQEDLQRERMRLLYLSGDRPGAIRHYDELRKMLDEEMGVPPMAETRALYDAIITDRLQVPTRHPQAVQSPSPSRSTAPVGQLPFTGRNAELKTLHELASTRKLILIEGEPGIGKTRLAEEFIRSEKVISLKGVARELEQSLPYQPVIEALRSLLASREWSSLRASLEIDVQSIWLAEVSRLIPELSGMAPGVDVPVRAANESRLWEGINQFLAALARHRPVILFIDDLHWADASTIALLGYLARQPLSAPISFLGTTRPVLPRMPLALLLQALTREDRLARLNLSRLSTEDVFKIAHSLSPENAGPLADWLLRNSEGNPYILVELVRHARENRVLSPEGERNLEVLFASPIVPQTIYSLIQSRLERLPEAARRVLDAAVASGRQFEFEVVWRAAGLSEIAALDALDELRAAGLIIPLDESCFAFDHSLTIEVAYREVGELRHRLLHRRLAEVMESIHRDRLENIAGQLAWHFSEGNAHQRASPYAFIAGQQAARLAAWAEAIAFFEQSLKGCTAEQRVTILMALGEVHMKAGHFAQATEVYREALTLVHPGTDGELGLKIQLSIARSLLSQARFDEIIAIVKKVLAKAGPENAMVAEWMWGAALSLEGSDLMEADQHLRTAEQLWDGCSGADHSNLAQIKFEQGSVAAQQGDLQRAIKLYHESLSAALQADNELGLEQRILAHNNLAYHMHLLGDPEARNYALAGLKLAREKGILGLHPYLFSTLGEISLADGDLGSAEKYFNEGLAIAEQLSVPERVAGLTANLGLVAIQRGEPALAIYRLSTALGLADSLGTRHLAAQIRIWLAPLLPLTEARARLKEARAIVQTSGRLRLLEEVLRLEQELFSPG